ncbi:hypothetical protein HanXRQr2_Chr10g0451641 [Helianthus annuus]|uniref:Uncharacterized protein n=1 Tax=Helianthus annuus TaxID=4232 RepID=A0A9K3N4V7_HELAN|nr:hypothetical protein HanXRQr2_Chr10g0451641 [Helianthus annuus]
MSFDWSSMKIKCNVWREIAGTGSSVRQITYSPFIPTFKFDIKINNQAKISS